MYVIAYDISSPKRLQRVARLMKKFGGRAQKSVFECHLSNERLFQLQKKIKKIIDMEKDSVRFSPPTLAAILQKKEKRRKKAFKYRNG